MASHAPSEESALNTDEGDTPLNAENCPNCHRLEHKIEKQDSELAQLGLDLTEAATRLRQAPAADGHQDIASLLDCPSCGPPALQRFESDGGAVLQPGKVQPGLVEIVKKHFPFLEEGIEIEVNS